HSLKNELIIARRRGEERRHTKGPGQGAGQGRSAHHGTRGQASQEVVHQPAEAKAAGSQGDRQEDVMEPQEDREGAGEGDLGGVEAQPVRE
ncbi:MAG TPA: hypothetical protein PKX44_08505, partial [Methanomassiliicoccaceae archaeon]|nr:hypothetical protein [Methanomassiliicoccaceae archaeon]